MRNHLLLVLLFSLVTVLGACGGSTALSTIPLAQPAMFTGQLPSLPLGTEDARESSLATFSGRMGDDVFDSHNATLVPSTADLAAPSGVADNLAWAMYQFGYPPQPLDMLEVVGHFYDQDALSIDPNEGYYVGIADYDSGAWQITGPYTEDFLRLPISPSEINAESPGGFVYVAVFTHDGNHFLVDQVHSGFSTPEAYSEEWLPKPHGEVVNQWCDIQVDSAGNPQIAYTRGQLMLGFGAMNPDLWIARRTPTAWEPTQVDTTYGVAICRLALGDGGRRALAVVTDETPPRLILKIDDGGGTFSSEIVVATLNSEELLPALLWVNGVGDPSGEKDTLILTYQVHSSGDDFFIHSYRWDGVLPDINAPIFPGAFKKPTGLHFTSLSSGHALLSIPDYDSLPPQETDFLMAEYDPAAGWSMGAYTDMTGVPAEVDPRFNPGASVVELPSGELGGAVVREDDGWIILGRTNAGSWEASPQDLLPVRVPTLFSVSALPSGEVAFISTSGNSYPAIYAKEPLTTDPPTTILLDSSIQAARQSTMAVDQLGVMHACAMDFNGQGLFYYQVALGGEVTRELVDNGGDGSGMYFDAAHIVPMDGGFYLFVMDGAHLAIRYSSCFDGIWSQQGTYVPTDGTPYFILKAGYLEDVDLLYVVYFNLLDYATKVCTFNPTSPDYQTNELSMTVPIGMMSPWSNAFADDETNLAVLMPGIQLIHEAIVLEFSLGPPRAAPHPSEVVHAAESAYAGSGYLLSYNSFHETWEAVTHGNDEQTVNYFARLAPDSWLGPQVIAYQPQDGSDGYAKATGLNSNTDNGETYITVLDHVAGAPLELANLYVRDWSAGTWSTPHLIRGIDMTLHTDAILKTTPDATGKPIVGIYHQNPGLQWNVWMLKPQATGYLYDSMFNWVSPVLNPMNLVTPFDIANIGDERIVISMIEGDTSAPMQGQVCLYYPW